MAAQISSPGLVKGARGARSTIALKLAMAISGLIFVAFVLVHMYGNLMAFGGEARFNAYAEHIRTVGEPMVPYGGLLWIVRVVLLVALVVHVGSAAHLWRRARQARPVRYQVKRNVSSALSSRTMRWGGLFLLLFIIWHLLEFTILKVSVNPGRQGLDVTQNPYQLVVASFQTWWLTLIYLLAMAALGLHLHHGVWSASQTLGLTSTAKSRRMARTLGWAVAIVIAGGFSLVPVFVLAGVITQ